MWISYLWSCRRSSRRVIDGCQRMGLGDYPFIHGVGIGSMSIKPPNKALNPDAPNDGAPVS